jgi:hypothetical protein
MRKQLEALLTRIEALKLIAEDKCDSENEKTVERYENITGMLDEAIDSVQQAIDEFDS